MKALKLKKLIFISFISLALFASCKNWLTSSKPQITDSDKSSDSITAIDAQNETAELSIQISNGKAARTVNPNNYNAESFVNFVLTGKLEGTTTEKQLFSAEGFDKIDGTSVALKCGTWELTLSAKFNGITFSDTKTIEIKRTQQNRITFTLKPTEHFGGFEIKYDFNGGGEGVPPTAIRKAEAVLKKADGTGAETKYVRNEAQIAAANNMAVFSRDITNSAERLESGSYLFTVKFYADANDPTPINTREDILCIQDGLMSAAEIRINFNEIYEINYGYIDDTNKPQFFDTSDFENATGTVIKSYSIRSNFDLPIIQVPGKIFLGWKLNDLSATDHISKVDEGTTGTLDLVADLRDPVVYVSSSGNDSKTGFSLTEALKTIDGVCETIMQYGNPTFAWTIKISGVLKGGQNNNDYAQCLLPSTITTDYAKSIELTGATGLNTDNIPQDVIDRGKTYVSGHYETGSAVRVETSVPVTITNLMVTRGYYTKGAGLFIAEGSTVKLGNGVVIVGNETGSNGRGGGVHNEGTLFMYGSAVIGNPQAVTWAVGDAGSNLYSYLTYPSLTVSERGTKQLTANYAGDGGGIYNGSGETYNTVAAKVYFGYSGYEADGITPQKQTLTGGLIGNGASNGAGIYNQQNCFVYYDSGIIQYGTAYSTGGGIYNYGSVEMTGGELKQNLAYHNANSTFSGGGVYNGRYNYKNAEFTMAGGEINKNYATYGGGIYNTGDLYIYGTAFIGDKTATTVATATSCGNKAGEGGAIYNSSGNVNIGYKKDGSVDINYTTNGGIVYNLATDIYHTGNFYGGAIYQAGSNGEGIIKIASGTIAYNSSDDLGGAIYISSSKNLEISGGTIRNNFATNGGGAICNTNKDALSIKGNLSIPKGADNKNDIYLKGSLADITITGALNSSFTAYLNLKPHSRTYAVLKGDSEIIKADYTKFEIAPYTITDYNGITYTPKLILTDGTLISGNQLYGSYLIEGDTWDSDVARYIEAMTESGTVRVGGTITWGLASNVINALKTKSEDFRLILDLSKTTGWSDSMPSFAFEADGEETKGRNRLENVILPDTVSVISSGFGKQGPVFNNCINLKSITIPVRMSRIWNDTFTGCTSLTDVYYTGSQAQKEARCSPNTSSGFQDTTILAEGVTWHYTTYGFVIALDVGTDSDIDVSVTKNGSAISEVSQINKGDTLVFTANSGYSTYKWKIDGSIKSETATLSISTATWVVGATYTVSLIAEDSSGNEDSYFAQITVSE